MTEDEPAAPEGEKDRPPTEAPDAPKERSLRKVWIAAGVLLVGGAVAFAATRGRDETAPLPALSASPSPSPVTPLLDAVPRDVMWLASLDVARLRRTRAYAMLKLSGIASIEEARTQCDLDPLERLSEVGFFVPADGSVGEFGIAASGGLGADEVVACTSKILESRGGKPLVSSLGSFRTVRDASSTRVGELAVRDGGPVMIGAGAYLRTMIDTTDRAVPAVRENKVHTALRAAVGDDAVLAVSAILTEEQRQVVRDEAKALGEAGPRALSAILAAAAGVRIDGDRALLHGVVLVDGGRADEVTGALEPMLAATPYAGRVKLVSEGSSVHAYLELTVDELAALVVRLPALGGAFK